MPKFDLVATVWWIVQMRPKCYVQRWLLFWTVWKKSVEHRDGIYNWFCTEGVCTKWPFSYDVKFVAFKIVSLIYRIDTHLKYRWVIDLYLPTPALDYLPIPYGENLCPILSIGHNVVLFLPITSSRKGTESLPKIMKWDTCYNERYVRSPRNKNCFSFTSSNIIFTYLLINFIIW